MWRQRPGGLAQEGSERRAREAGVTRKTIRKGLGELEAGALYQPGERIRQQGGGRKKHTVKDATLRADLEGMLDPKGDPESLLRWTSKEVAQVEESPHAPRAYDWGDRHPGDVTRDGLFPQSHQEEYRGRIACRPGCPISAHQSHRQRF
jgi:hypothetical protein